MSERFTEDEARRIFARAAERQHADEPGPPGLSLAELQEIGRSAGLDPAQIAAAVTEVRGATPPADTSLATFLGAPVEVRTTRVLSAPVTDAAWEQMVARLRRTFDTKGTPTDIGRVREWTGTNSQGGLSNLRATVEPVEGGARVTIETSKAKEALSLRVLAVVMGVISVLMAALLFFTEAPVAAALGIGALPALLALIVNGSVRWSYGRWSATRERQFDALLDQFELIVRDATAAPDTTAESDARAEAGTTEPEAPRLDLDALVEPEDEDTMAESRRRTRS